MFAEAIKYPMNSDESTKNILIGGVLSLFGFLIIPALIVAGYYIRVMRTTVEGDAEPPEFGDWGDLLVDGVKAAVIGIVYMIIPGIVFFVTVGSSIMAIFSGGPGQGAAAAGAGMMGIGMLVSMLLYIIFGYFLPAGLTNFAREGGIGDAFDVGTVKDVALTSDYAVAWVLAIVVSIIGGIITGILGIIPIIGFIIGVFVAFYFYVAAVRLYAEGYSNALGITTETAGGEAAAM